MSEVTYLDHAATTPLRAEVAAAMADVVAQPLGNPTGSHPPAQRARRLLEEARDEVAAVVGCEPGEVIFTSGGTESANLAVLGTSALSADGDGSAPLLVHSAVEHPAVLESCRAASRDHGVELCALPVDAAGVIDLDALEAALERQPRLAAVMLANNETGVLQPLDGVVALVAALSPRTTVFTDAVQAAPFVDLAAAGRGADLIALSAHKVGGPVGIGALIVRAPVAVAARTHGGGQERARRSGTQHVVGAVGMAVALRLAADERVEQAARVASLRDRLAAGLVAASDGVHRTVPFGTHVLPGHLHLCFEDIEREELLVALGQRGICISGGSSCASGALELSHVLSAMGVPAALALGAARFSLGAETGEADIARALAEVPDVVAGLRGAVRAV